MPEVQLPEAFCWTRFGAEAGESIDRILTRKEQERRTNHGTFFWGIGNAIGPGVAELVARCKEPEVLFSPIKSRPRLVDISPEHVVRWRAGETLSGDQMRLPEGVAVTSRVAAIDAPRPRYALVCSSTKPLRMSNLGDLRFRDLRNLRSGKPLGTSQVTAVVKRVPAGTSPGEGDYVVALRVALAAPYLVRLREPVPVETDQERRALAA